MVEKIINPTKRLLGKIVVLFVLLKENDYNSKILSGNFLIYYLVFLFFLQFLIAPLSLLLPKGDLFCQISREAIIRLTNKERQEKELPKLKENKLLDEAAEMKAKDMFAKGYFDHRSPNGITPWFWFHRAGYNFKAAGENLGIGFLDSKEIFEAWNNSPGHKANIVSPYYTEIGVAVLTGNFKGKENTIVVQLFGSKKIISGLPKKKIVGKKEKILAENKFGKQADKNMAGRSKNGKKIEGNRQKNSNIGKNRTGGTNEENSDKSIREGEKVVKEANIYIEKLETRGRKPSIAFLAIKFILLDYFGTIRKIIFYSMVMVFISLVSLFFMEAGKRNHKAMAKAVFFIILSLIFISLNKSFFLSFIPHNLWIY